VARTIRIGCSGWVYRDWRGVLYPPGLAQRDWLARYAEVFDTVEVNSTFYRLAHPEAVERWVEATPPTFLFTVKASRYLTHFTRLRDFERGVGRFYAGIAPLVASRKLAAVLWQLPARQERDDAMLAETLPRLPAGRHAFEFRHPSWFADEVLALLRAHDVALVIGDHPDRPWQPLAVTSPLSLVRLHYGHRGRRGNYSEGELIAWAGRVRELARDADVLVYFNNDWEGFAVRNALRLRELLGQSPAESAGGEKRPARVG
jgi:uncharacterized protein YecE (DUF72 family)